MLSAPRSNAGPGAALPVPIALKFAGGLGVFGLKCSGVIAPGDLGFTTVTYTEEPQGSRMAPSAMTHGRHLDLMTAIPSPSRHGPHCPADRR